MKNFEYLKEATEPIRASLLAHPIYNDLRDAATFNQFMEQHVYAVWDFMSLLKALQHQLTGMQLPWVPSRDPMVTRLINDIVMAEESDEDGQGGYCSHFELYLRAMREAGASTAAIAQLVSRLQAGESFDAILAENQLPAHIQQFLAVNYAVVKGGKPHEIAASFTLGREDLIPDLFRQLVNELVASNPKELATLAFYFERHIHLDEDHHGPLAAKMIALLCGDDATKWEEAKQAALAALEARKVLWDGIHATLGQEEMQA
ncbi:hypothetical protein A3SI_17304 [Nitritalea halalkaliphila LW7]|uniref:Heme oxygenase n=1 Tax=Nitritalea halalkaliphila LW7 TaxID=1189621 RepID=I5BVS6_9BACT|nr:DUF3050 domain-containing protein [Nitritalea halalkaliphila]EIM73678.1 hypothetical protein A3SI_17304 [Nitritalea halalkaliphila LW7]